MTYKEAVRIINADTLSMFFKGMDVTVVEFLNNVDPEIKESVLEWYNEDSEKQSYQPADAINEIPAIEVIQCLEDEVLKGHNESVISEYLESLEETYTIIQIDGWNKVVELDE